MKKSDEQTDDVLGILENDPGLSYPVESNSIPIDTFGFPSSNTNPQGIFSLQKPPQKSSTGFENNPSSNVFDTPSGNMSSLGKYQTLTI